MEYIQERVWGLLTQEEQTVLSLIHARDITITSVANLLKKRAYQVKMINYRAVKIFRTWHTYLEDDPTKPLFSCKPPPAVSHFLSLIIEEGLSTHKARIEVLIKEATTKPELEKSVMEYLETLEEKDPDLLIVFQEIDRYRFRFLPLKYQWPTPYRRRRNKAFRNLAEKIYGYDSYIYHLAHEPRPKSIYIPLVDYKTFSYVELPDRKDLRGLVTNKLGFPFFKDLSEAAYLAEVIFNYNKVRKRTPRIGRKYTFQLRVTLEKAENYKTLFKIPENFVDATFIFDDRDIRVKMQDSLKKSGISRADDETFY
jgi:hypothetical protein